MKILLVQPRTPPSFWSMSHAVRLEGRKATHPPLGLLTVAAMLPAHWDLRILDMNVEPLREESLRWADLVFLTGMYIHRDSMAEVVRRCNGAGTPVVVGGPFVAHVRELERADHYVLNEAEITLPLFLADLERGCPAPVYSTPQLADIRNTPIPRWDLVELGLYSEGLIQYSRGCPFHCDFCDVTTLFGRVPRTKTPHQVVAELEAMGDLRRVRRVFFADDNFIGNKKHLKTELLPALVEWRRKNGVKVPFRTQVTITLADDPELMELMIEAGFRSLFVGIETPDEESLAHCGKSQNTRRDLLENVRTLQEAGFEVSAGLIVGFDTDTSDIFQRQVDFVQESGIVMALVNTLKAPPGTRLFERMVAEGRMIDAIRDGEGEISFVPSMGSELLSRGFKEVVGAINTPEAVYARTLKFLERYGAPDGWGVALSRGARDLMPFLRSVYFIGLVDPGRWFYWKLLVWTLFHRPRRLPLALELAVMAYHLRTHYRTECLSPLAEGEKTLP